jgi:hypothetical protein
MSRRAAVVVASAALVAGLSACGGDDKDPLEGVDAPAAPTAAATPTPTLASAPEAATKKTDEGAKQFVKYYFETVINEATVQGKMDKLVEVSDPNCVVCRATVGDIAFFVLGRQRAEGGKVSVSDLKVANSGDLTTVEFKYSKTKLSYKNLDGSTSYSVPSVDPIAFYAQAQWDAATSSWKMRQITPKSAVEKS